MCASLYTADDRTVRTWGQLDYVDDPTRFPDDARYTAGDGVAWFVLGWEVERTEDTEWDGIVCAGDRVLAVMVGDDAPHSFDPDDLTQIGELDYCAECGQIGCCHDARSRD